MQKIRDKILLSIALAALIYLGFIIYGDFEKLTKSFQDFSWHLLPVLLILSLGNYFSRFFKWEYYLKLIGVKIPGSDSLSIFMSGLVLSITPGKMGELLKSYLIKQADSTPISKTAPIVLAERITDFLSLTIMALAGAYYFNYGKNIALIIGLMIISGIFIITSKKIFNKVLFIISKIKIFSRHTGKIQSAYDSSSKLLALKPLVSMTLLSVVSWGFECLGYYLILKDFGLNANAAWSFFSYSFSTIVGALSMLPGGLGVTEGSLTIMTMRRGFSESDAFASTFIIRAVTLWFAVLVGAIGLLFYQKKFGKVTIDTQSQL